MKKNVTLVSLLGSCLYLVANKAVFLGICSYEKPSCVYLFDSLEGGLSFFVVLLVFSLITYFLPEKTFQAWWRFARVAAPIILVLSLLINLEVHHSQNGDLQNIFDLPVLITLYTIFILGSLWQIYQNRS